MLSSKAVSGKPAAQCTDIRTMDEATVLAALALMQKQTVLRSQTRDPGKQQPRQSGDPKSRTLGKSATLDAETRKQVELSIASLQHALGRSEMLQGAADVKDEELAYYQQQHVMVEESLRVLESKWEEPPQEPKPKKADEGEGAALGTEEKGSLPGGQAARQDAGLGMKPGVSEAQESANKEGKVGKLKGQAWDIQEQLGQILEDTDNKDLKRTVVACAAGLETDGSPGLASDVSGLRVENRGLRQEVQELRRLLEWDLKLGSSDKDKLQVEALKAEALAKAESEFSAYQLEQDSLRHSSEAEKLREEKVALEQKVRFMAATHLAEVNGLRGEKTKAEQKWGKVVKGLKEQLAAMEDELSQLQAQRQQDVTGRAHQVTALTAQKLALEDELAQARSTAEAASAVSFKMAMERKRCLAAEEQLRKEVGALGIQVEALKQARAGLEEELDAVRQERDALWRRVQEQEAGAGGDQVTFDCRALERELELLKKEKAATERDLRKELQLAAVQLGNLLADKAMLEEKLDRERRLQPEVWKSDALRLAES